MMRNWVSLSVLLVVLRQDLERGYSLEKACQRWFSGSKNAPVWTPLDWKKAAAFFIKRRFA
jgi:hypothetical protein